jgi:hypothetical protein
MKLKITDLVVIGFVVIGTVSGFIMGESLERNQIASDSFHVGVVKDYLYVTGGSGSDGTVTRMKIYIPALNKTLPTSEVYQNVRGLDISLSNFVE